MLVSSKHRFKGLIKNAPMAREFRHRFACVSGKSQQLTLSFHEFKKKIKNSSAASCMEGIVDGVEAMGERL